MHKQVEEWWNNNPKPIPVILRLKIMRLGYKTGSNVFGGFDKEKSDYDLMVLDNECMELGFDFDTLMNSNGFYLSGDYWLEGGHSQCVYLKMSPNDIRPTNIIYFHNEEEYNVWVHATDLLESLIMDNSRLAKFIKQRKNRLEMFELLKSFYRDGKG